jgi:hypothetical protein
LIRGGRFDNASTGGVFAVTAFNDPSSSGIDIGFRCAR